MTTSESEDVFAILGHLVLMEVSYFKKDVEKKGQKNVTWKTRLRAQ